MNPANICQCQICKKILTQRGLSKHIINSHKILPKDYYDKFIKKPGEGECKLCGKETSFISLKDGYRQYCSKVCLSRCPIAQKKRKETCLKKYGVDNPSKVSEVKTKIKQTWTNKYGDHPMRSEKIVNKVKKTMLKKYGVEHPLQHKEIRNKVKQTCLKKYGVECHFQSEDIKEKSRKTWLKKHGVKNPAQVPIVKEKIQQTCLERYGVKNAIQSPVIKEKIKQINLKKYGVSSTLQVPEVKKKIKQTCLERYGVETPFQSPLIQQKIKETNLRKYGVEFPLQAPEFKEKTKQTYLERYGVEHPLQSPEVRKRVLEKFNASFLKKMSTFLQELNLKLLDPKYYDCYYKHQWQCLKCGTRFEQTWNAIQQGYLCPSCNPRPKSKGENELADFLLALGFNIIRQNRTILNSLELDIVIPEKRIAIEYNGLYWHNEEHIDKNYHLQKTQICQSKGYRLIHIFEDEWILKKDIVKSRLKHILGKTEDLIHIGARKCIIREISTKEKNTFLEQFHIQGPDASKVKLGAFYQKQLVAVMTFSHGSLAKGVKKQNSLVWELNRFCSHSDFVISGIASKLLNYFKKNYQWRKIFSYADRRWSVGDLYKKLGFDLECSTRPNYWYVKDFQRIHRFALRKRPDEPKDISEALLRVKEGYVRVWDCGNLKFVVENS